MFFTLNPKPYPLLFLTFSYKLLNIYTVETISGCDAMVAYQLPKLGVAGSSPVSRSKFDYKRHPAFTAGFFYLNRRT